MASRVRFSREETIFWLRIRFGFGSAGDGEGEEWRDVVERAGVGLEERFDYFGEEVCEGFFWIRDD